MTAPAPRYTLTKTLSGVLPVDGNKVLIADLEAFLSAAKRKGAVEVSFTAAVYAKTNAAEQDRAGVIGVKFSTEAAET